MKGLLLKDFYLGKKSLIIGSVIILLIQIMIYIVRFSFIYGNPADPEWLAPDERESSLMNIDIIFTVLTGALPVIVFFEAVSLSVYSDFKCGWNMFIYTSPYSEKQIIRLKTAEVVVSWIAAALAGLIFNGIYILFFRNENSILGTVIFIMLLPVILMFEFLILSLSYKHKNANAVSVRILLFIIAPVYIACYAGIIYFAEYITDKFSNEQDALISIINALKSWIFDNIGIILAAEALLTIISCLLAYKRCISLLKRREIICGD